MSAEFEHSRRIGDRARAGQGFEVFLTRTVALSDDLSEVVYRTPGSIRLDRVASYKAVGNHRLTLAQAIDLRDALSSAIEEINAVVAQNAAEEAAQ